MTIEAIRLAVAVGYIVHWQNSLYRVIPDKVGGLLVWCEATKYGWGLVRHDGSMNGRPAEFYLAGKE